MEQHLTDFDYSLFDSVVIIHQSDFYEDLPCDFRSDVFATTQPILSAPPVQERQQYIETVLDDSVCFADKLPL